MAQHSRQTDLIKVSSFRVASDHSLTYLISEQFRMGEEVQVTGIAAEPHEDGSRVWVMFYRVRDGIAQVLEAKLRADGSVSVAEKYALMDETGSKGMSMRAMQHSHSTGAFMYGGSS